MTLNKILIVVALGFAISACAERNPQVKIKSDYQLKELFEHDGCKVYRFSDNGRYRYYTKCEFSSETMTSVSSGKTTYPESNSTGYTVD